MSATHQRNHKETVPVVPVFATDFTWWLEATSANHSNFLLATVGCQEVINWSLGLCDWSLSNHFWGCQMVYIFLSISGKSKYIIIYVSNLHCIHLGSNYTGRDDFSGDCARIFLAQMPSSCVALALSKQSKYTSDHCFRAKHPKYRFHCHL